MTKKIIDGFLLLIKKNCGVGRSFLWAPEMTKIRTWVDDFRFLSKIISFEYRTRDVSSVETDVES